MRDLTRSVGFPTLSKDEDPKLRHSRTILLIALLPASVQIANGSISHQQLRFDLDESRIDKPLPAV
jgi:hypothetical protein